ncbi:MAG: L-serine ammonia-lyase, iron-sulfur-dependent, subunit alpha [Turicibacter sp.]|nr:L-serine ammonia-lyase, iron-sulfur-dependent, subunit alpha [Turicibacter sp.]
MFKSVEELLAICEKENKFISEVMLDFETERGQQSRAAVMEQMRQNLIVMRASVESGFKGVFSTTGLTGGDAVKLDEYLKKGRTLSGETMVKACASAIATNEVNAAMGIICASPTAGSAGTLPGVLFTLEEKLELTEDQLVNFLFTSGAFGLITANNAFIAGAAGGCQAEIGTSSAMAAAGAVEVAGGSPKQSADAFAIALANMLGLVCDPVAGLVEVPCIKRNAAGASNALISADMALAGLVSEIPADEVISAMYEVGIEMDTAFKETAEGGLANTPTGRAIEARIFGKRPGCDGCAMKK